MDAENNPTGDQPTPNTSLPSPDRREGRRGKRSRASAAARRTADEGSGHVHEGLHDNSNDGGRGGGDNIGHSSHGHNATAGGVDGERDARQPMLSASHTRMSADGDGVGGSGGSPHRGARQDASSSNGGGGAGSMASSGGGGTAAAARSTGSTVARDSTATAVEGLSDESGAAVRIPARPMNFGVGALDFGGGGGRTGGPAGEGMGLELPPIEEDVLYTQNMMRSDVDVSGKVTKRGGQAVRCKKQVRRVSYAHNFRVLTGITTLQ